MTPVIRNAIVTLIALVAGYLVPTAMGMIDLRYSEAGRVIQAGQSGEEMEFLAGEFPAEALFRGINRMRFIYVPLALVICAGIIAFLSHGWQWSWLLTGIGCSMPLVFLAVVQENLGTGIAVSFVTYVVLAGAVTFVVSRREFKPPLSSDPDAAP